MRGALALLGRLRRIIMVVTVVTVAIVTGVIERGILVVGWCVATNVMHAAAQHRVEGEDQTR